MPILSPEAFEQGYFQTHLEVSLQRMLEPISGERPAGIPLRSSPGYRRLQEDRRSDDMYLPMGAWGADLRRANWPRVSLVAAHMLAEYSKDLQLAAWLLEAEIHQRGVDALAPCFALIRALCERYLDGNLLHPRSDDGTFEAQGNVLLWIDEKLGRSIALSPLLNDAGRDLPWVSWEMAHRIEGVRAPQGARAYVDDDTLSLADLAQALARQPEEALRARLATLDIARASLTALDESIQALVSGMPSMPHLRGLLERMQAPLREELARRGLQVHPPSLLVPAEPVAVSSASDTSGATDGASAPHDAEAPGERMADGDRDHAFDPVAERERAYERLAEIARLLARIEPHSPVPYLIHRAVAWGGMSSAELYHEVVVKSGGRIDMRDVLGIVDASAEP